MYLLLALGSLGVVGLLLYWLFVLGEGTYLGTWAVRLVYQFGARHYDTIHAPAQATDHTFVLPLIQTAIQDRWYPHILDVATGTGRIPLLLASSEGFRGNIVGTDLTPAMLEQARKRHQQLCPEQSIIWHCGDAAKLPWPTSSYDLVTCLEALEFFTNPTSALAEMARVLRPGGTLLLSTWPGRWVYALPGRAFTQKALHRRLTQLGFAEITVYAWQPGHYDLVVARMVSSS